MKEINAHWKRCLGNGLRAAGSSLRYLLSFWLHPRLVIWFLLTAAAVVVLRVPFARVQIIPHHLDFNPGIAVVPVAAVVFGLAGAWGVLAGSLLGDALFHQVDALSLYRAVGLFFFAAGTTRLWGAGSGVGKFIFVSWTGCLVAAAWRALGSEMLRLYPFVYILSIIVCHHLLFSALLGVPLYGLMKSQWIPHFGTWREVEKAGPVVSAPWETLILASAGLLACLGGAYASRLFYNVGLFEPFVLGSSTGRLVPLVVIPILLTHAAVAIRPRPS